MQQEFFQDSPFFREDIQTLESSLSQLASFFTLLKSEANIAYSKGKEYCYAMRRFLTSIIEHPGIDVLGHYRPALLETQEILQSIIDCQESFLLSLETLCVK